MIRSPRTITHMWPSPGVWTEPWRFGPVTEEAAGESKSAAVCSAFAIESLHRWLVDGLELVGFHQKDNQAAEPEAEDHRSHPEGDRSVPRERPRLGHEHRDRQDLGDDLPDSHVGQPFREYLISVVEDRNREGEVGRREAAQRANV